MNYHRTLTDVPCNSLLFPPRANQRLSLQTLIKLQITQQRPRPRLQRLAQYQLSPAARLQSHGASKCLIVPLISLENSENTNNQRPWSCGAGARGFPTTQMQSLVRYRISLHADLEPPPKKTHFVCGREHIWDKLVWWTNGVQWVLHQSKLSSNAFKE